jgi:Na+/H+-dicarboxylate symporter
MLLEAPSVPVAGMALILDVAHFLIKCCSPTNRFGNAVETIVVIKWHDSLDSAAKSAALQMPRRPSDSLDKEVNLN